MDDRDKREIEDMLVEIFKEGKETKGYTKRTLDGLYDIFYSITKDELFEVLMTSDKFEQCLGCKGEMWRCKE